MPDAPWGYYTPFCHDGISAFIMKVQALIASDIEQDKDLHLPAFDKWLLQRGTHISTYSAMDWKMFVAYVVAVLCTARIILIRRVYVTVKWQSWSVAELHVRVDMSGRTWKCGGVLTCARSHRVGHQSAHRIIVSQLSFAVKVFDRYWVSEANFWATNRNAALTLSYIIPFTSWAWIIWSGFTAKAFAQSEITILSMMRFGLPCLQAQKVMSIIILTKMVLVQSRESGICATEIRWINYHWGIKGFILPINVICLETTPVIRSPSLS